MKNNKKRGFTIVELVIVIAVIAILAAVLIPTFSNVIAKANESKAMQEARNMYYDWLAGQDLTSGLDDIDLYITSGEYSFEVTNGQFSTTKLGAKKTDADTTHGYLVADTTETTGWKYTAKKSA